MLDAPTPPRRDARADVDSPRRRARREAEAAALAQREAEAATLARVEADVREARAAARRREELAARHREVAAAAAHATQEVPAPPRAPAAAPAPVSAAVPAPRAAAASATSRASSRRTAAPAPAPRARPAARAPLPWHLRRAFLLPVVAVCLLGSLSCLALVGARYADVRAAGGRLGDVVLSASDSHRTPSAATTAAAAGAGRRSSATASATRTPAGGGTATSPAAAPAPSATAGAAPPTAPPSTQPSAEDAPAGASGGSSASGAGDQPAGDDGTNGADGGAATPADQSTDQGADQGAADAPGGSGATASAGAQTVSGDVTYEGFGSAKAASVDYTVDGEFDGTTAGGASFSLPQKGSATWKGWYVAVTATDGGQAGCRIRDASGRVLVEHTAARPGDTAECSWGEQDDVPQGEDPGDG